MHIVLKAQAVTLGLKKYFTGKPCKQGHISERYTQKSTCIECLKISSESRRTEKNESDKRRYHNQTPEQRAAERKRLREYNAKKYWEEPEKFRIRSKSYAEKNREFISERTRSFRLKNREKILKKRREEYSLNPEPHRSRSRNFYKKNVENAKAYQRSYSAKHFIYYGKMAKERAKKVTQATPKWANQNNIDEIYRNRPNGCHVDHIVPLRSKFVCGLHCEANLQYLTVRENIAKSNRIWPDMW